MIPRQEIEFTLAMAEKGVRAEAPPEVMAELCRVYLAWLEAPEVEVQSADPPGADYLGFIEAYGSVPSIAGLEVGKRVRLVVVDD